MTTIKDKIIQAEKRVRLYVGLKGGTQHVLRITDSEQYEDRYNWFQPTEADKLLEHVMKITAKGSKVMLRYKELKLKAEGMLFDSVYADELQNNKGAVYIGYFMKGTQKRGLQVRRASTGTEGERIPAGSTREIDII
tara:strand:+ start:238 stop:648 length:411 start_codon:yes stop_codon:yes gene_type:complete